MGSPQAENNFVLEAKIRPIFLGKKSSGRNEKCAGLHVTIVSNGLHPINTDIVKPYCTGLKVQTGRNCKSYFDLNRDRPAWGAPHFTDQWTLIMSPGLHISSDSAD